MLPDEKILQLQSRLREVLREQTISSKTLQSVVGSLNFASFTVPYGRLHFRETLTYLNKVLKKGIDFVTLPKTSQKELNWWLENCHRESMIHVPPPEHFLTTDASDVAWGAQLDRHSVSGQWTDREKKLHCNQKEMIAILRVLQTFCPQLSNSTILVQCDNKTVVAFLRREGGTKSASLMKLTKLIFCLLERHSIHVEARHIPGKYNCHADHLSRHLPPPEWHLLPQGTEKVFQKFGVPLIDLFASERAKVVMNYVSLDQKDHPWIFPPPYLIPKVLEHLNRARGIYLLVVPRWERAFWRPDLKARAVAPPFTIKNLPQVLIDTATGLPPAKVQEMVIEVWKCGGGLRA
ncbi:uncharacterized protein LOC121730978 [Aricia agestis]|uniref:uncharacterized protein LOC121730978 n=1 Tax=Aricia agestis TaxID=91739 RepID=UPI001C2081C6|nr:uncharacterized protein LOC121730978 [Aricia agestis]